VNLLPFFQWCESTSFGTMIRESPWAFAVIESVHLLALAVIGGSVLLVDLRLLGWGLKRQPVAELARDAQPWMNASLITLLVTGICLFFSEPTKCYYSTPFWVKMTSLFFAIIYSYTVRYRYARKDDARIAPTTAKVVALVSLALWFGVGASGRWIGFSG
jgi:hypothetical protein